MSEYEQLPCYPVGGPYIGLVSAWGLGESKVKKTPFVWVKVWGPIEGKNYASFARCYITHVTIDRNMVRHFLHVFNLPDDFDLDRFDKDHPERVDLRGTQVAFDVVAREYQGQQRMEVVNLRSPAEAESKRTQRQRKAVPADLKVHLAKENPEARKARQSEPRPLAESMPKDDEAPF